MSLRRSPLSCQLELSGLKLHLLEWAGTEPRMILLHGWLDQAMTFAWLAEQLELNLLAWDARGYGRSGWAAEQDFYHFFDYLWDLHQLIESLGQEKVILLGHSMGGMIASLYSACFPEKVAGLISLEGWIVPDTPVEKMPDRVRLWIEQRSQGWPVKSLGDFEQTAQRILKQDSRLQLEQARILAPYAAQASNNPDSLIWRYDPRHRMRSPQGFRLDQALAFWHKITCPVLLAYGAESEALKLPDWQLRLEAFAQAEILAIPDAGHNLHLHQPELVAQAIKKWLAKINF